ncbi:MAG: hypothetical protein RBT67_02840 [Thauera sp.]|nr:hypothetical protein [Thauera sp.]
MTRDEIISMAREAGINFDPAKEGGDGIDCWYGDQYLPSGALQKFAALVAAAERTGCFRHQEVAMRHAVTAERAACAQIAREEIIDVPGMRVNDARLAQDLAAGSRVAARIESLILRRSES